MKTTPGAEGEPAGDLEEILKAGSGRLAGYRGWLALAVALGVGGVVTWRLLAERGEAEAPRFRTEPATVGSLVVTVSATGNLQPTNMVEVSSELSGIVTEVRVDENDRVTSGQELARLDTSKLRDAVARSRAALVVANAQVRQAEATVIEAQVALGRFRQAAQLSGGQALALSEMTAAEANLSRAEAGAAASRASVAEARANLRSDQTNLEKASIRSPIDGVVLTRNVESGQTVAATLQAPVLFTLAEDLTQMELRVSVDEADVAQVRVGQRATFTVDAWPGRQFEGTITRVGYGSEVTDGVVSYPAVLAVENPDLSLRPGMTATASIVTVTRESALMVPNAALRFDPALSSSPSSGAARGGFLGQLRPRPPRPTPRPRPPAAGGPPRVWVLRDHRPVPIEVQTGATDGQATEIVGGSLEPGTEVITEAAEGAP